MKRHLAVSGAALRGAASTQRQGPTHAPAFVCARCRRLDSRRALVPRLSVQHATFSSQALLRQDDATEKAAANRKDSVLPQTLYDLFPQTFPNGPPPSSPFTPDQRQLRKEFLQAQAKTHPDLVPAERKRQAEALSMRVNEAYKTLQDPLRRAQYLLSLRGIDVEDESAKMQENELLMEVMEVREAVDEAEDEAEVAALREVNNIRIADSVGVLEQAFARGDNDVAAQEAIRLRYWTNVEESIQGWEKGQGGGVIHH